MRTTVWILVALLAVGCDKKSNKEIMDESDAYRPRKEAEWRAAVIAPERRGPGFTVAPAPVVEPPAAPGPAYLYVLDIGLVTIDHGAATLTKMTTDLGYVKVIRDAPDGSLILAGNGVYRVKDGVADKLGGEASPAHVSDVAIAPDGKIWVIEDDLAAVWDGKAWTKYDKLVPAGDSLNAISVDGKDHVYVATGGQVFVFDGAWKSVYDTSKQKTEFNDPPLYRGVFVAPDGKLYMLSTRGTFVSDGKTVTHVDLGSLPVVRNGEILAATDAAIVHFAFATGKATVVPYPGPKPTGPSDIDRAGRRWTVVENGFAIVPSGAGGAVVWPAGSIPAIGGRVTAVHVVGSGPAEVPGAGAVAKGTLRGVVQKAGVAVGSAPVELCASPSSNVRKDSTPCAGREGYFATTTDKQGAFLTEVPLRDYAVVVEVGGQWYQLLGFRCAGMAAGTVCDVGVLELNNKL